MPLFGSPTQPPPYVPPCASSTSQPADNLLLDCYIAASFIAHAPWLPWQRRLQRALFGGGGDDDKRNGAVAVIARAASERRGALRRQVKSVFRWHPVTQDRLFAALRQLWPDDHPRVMLDLGCHAGHGIERNISDANIWLHHFNHTGSQVLGVDAFEDYALDLQVRFNRTRDLYPGVRTRALHYALHHQDLETPRELFWQIAKQTISCCIGYPACKDWDDAQDHHCSITRRRLGLHRLIKKRPHHHRNRTSPPPDNVDAQALPVPLPVPLPLPPPLSLDLRAPLPPSSYPSSVFRVVLRGKAWGSDHPPYPVRSVRADTLLRRELGLRTPTGAPPIDFVKVDVDHSWKEIGLEGLISARAFRVLVIEMDRAWGTFHLFERHRPSQGAAATTTAWANTTDNQPPKGKFVHHPTSWGLTDADQLIWLAQRYQYTSYIKLHCPAAVPAASYPGSSQAERTEGFRLVPLCSGREPSSDDDPISQPSARRPACLPAALSLRTFRAEHRIQDLLLVDDTRRPELKRLPALAAATCAKGAVRRIPARVAVWRAGLTRRHALSPRGDAGCALATLESRRSCCGRHPRATGCQHPPVTAARATASNASVRSPP